jgi:hypothetical protein
LVAFSGLEPTLDSLPVGRRAVANVQLATETGIGLAGTQPGTSFAVRAENADSRVASVGAPATQFSPQSGSVAFPAEGRRPGGTELSFVGGGKVSNALRVNVRLPAFAQQRFAIYQEFESQLTVRLETSAPEPWLNSVLTIRSTDPARLRLANDRSASTTEESIQLHWRAGQLESSPFFAHAFSNGDGGAASAALELSMLIAGFGFESTQPQTLFSGSSLSLFPRRAFTAQVPLGFTGVLPIGYRQGLGPISIPLSVSDARLLEVPATLVVNPDLGFQGGTGAVIRPLARGVATVTLGTAPGFATIPLAQRQVQLTVVSP